MSTRRTIIGNTAALYLLQGLNLVFPLIVMPHLLRTVGVDAFGKIAFTGAIVMALGVIIEFSFNYTATARIASCSSDLAAVSRIYSVVMATKATLMMGCTAALALLTVAVPALRESWPLIAAQWSLLLGEVLFPMWLFQGLQRLTFITAFNLVSRVTTLALLFIFVQTPEDAAAAAGIQAVHFVIVGILAQLTAHTVFGVRFQRASVADGRDLIRESARVFAGNLGSQAYTRTPLVIVGMLASSPHVGAFAIAHKIASVLTSLATPLAQSLYPHLCGLAVHHPRKIIALRNRSLLGVGFGLSAAVLVLNALGDQIVLLLSGEPNPLMLTMLLVYSPAIVLSGLNTILGKFVLAMRRFNEFQRMLVWAACVFLLISPPLTVWIGAYGVLLAIIAVETLVLVACLRIVRPSLLPSVAPRGAT